MFMLNHLESGSIMAPLAPLPSLKLTCSHLKSWMLGIRSLSFWVFGNFSGAKIAGSFREGTFSRNRTWEFVACLFGSLKSHGSSHFPPCLTPEELDLQQTALALLGFGIISSQPNKIPGDMRRNIKL